MFSGLPLLNTTCFLPGGLSFCANFLTLLMVWVSWESEQRFACRALYPQASTSVIFIRDPTLVGRGDISAVFPQWNSVALWILPLALWERALSVLSLFSTPAFPITGVCWYVLLEGCSAGSWGLSITRHKQRCCVEWWNIQGPNFRLMMMNGRRVTEQNRCGSLLIHKKILDAVEK